MKLSPEIAQSVWLPLSPSFRRAIQLATEEVFGGSQVVTTSFDEASSNEASSGEAVVLADVLRYHQKAEGPLVSTFYRPKSIGRFDIVDLIQQLYPQLMPYFIGCGTKNPVHHTAYVLEFMVTIGRTNCWAVD